MKKIYLVGGAVRDLLLGKTPNDKDYVAVGFSEDDLLSIGAQKIGKSFPVYVVPNYGEVALPRRETKTGIGHTGFEIETNNVSLEGDLKRRDLTINAIALDGKEVIDPFNGKDDLQKGILRHVSEAFIEDPLRVYRLARFFCNKWAKSIAPETYALIENISKIELQSLSAERVGKEFCKAMSLDYPQRFFFFLKKVGLLGVHFPELERMRFIPAGPKEHHGEGSTFIHTMMVLNWCSKLTRNLPNKEIIRISALLHDFGKLETDSNNWPRHLGHEENGLNKIEDFCKRLKLPSDYCNAAKLASKEHLRVHKVSEMAHVKVVDLIKTAQKTKLEVEGLAYVALADGLGRWPSKANIGPNLLLEAENKLNSFVCPPIPEKLKNEEIGLWVRMKMGEFIAGRII